MKKLLWHPLALEDLESIVEYCKLSFGINIARKVHGQIILSAQLLKTQPYLGHRDEDLSNDKREYCSLSCRQTRIIYSVHKEYIFIRLLWNNRQDIDRLHELIEDRE